MDGREILDYYRTRFQLEFCFRDGKQHAGITNSQSTDFRKLDFHFNASLAAVNLAKAACKRLGIAIPYPLASHSYTMLICLNDLFACLGLTQTCKLLTNFSKNSFYLLPEPLRLGEFLTNYCLIFARLIIHHLCYSRNMLVNRNNSEIFGGFLIR